MHRDKRKGYIEHPRTPDAYDGNCSKRQFDGIVKAWRRYLHTWEQNYKSKEELKTKHNYSNSNDICDNNCSENIDIDKNAISINGHIFENNLTSDIRYNEIVDYDNDNEVDVELKDSDIIDTVDFNYNDNKIITNNESDDDIDDDVL